MGEELVTTVINFFIYNIRKEFIRCYSQIADITEGKRGLLRFAKMTARNGNNATPWISIIIKLSQANGIFQSDLVFRLKINSTCTLSTVNYFWYFSWKIVVETQKYQRFFFYILSLNYRYINKLLSQTLFLCLGKAGQIQRHLVAALWTK